LLVETTNNFLVDRILGEERKHKLLIDLWNHNFKGLLIVGQDCGGIPYSYAYQLVVNAQSSPPPQWPEFMKRLCAVRTRTATVADANKLLYDSFFYYLNGHNGEEFSLPNDNQFIAGLFNITDGDIPVEWQLLLLTHKCILPSGTQKKVLQEGLLRITQDEAIKMEPAEVLKQYRKEILIT